MDLVSKIQHDASLGQIVDVSHGAVDEDLHMRARRGQFVDSAQVLFDDRDIVTVVNGLPGAIGYSLFAIKRLMEAPASDDLAVLVSLDSLFPGDLSYPISVSVGLVYLPERQDELQMLLDWGMDFLHSELGQMLQKQYGVSSVTSTRSETEGGDNAHLD